ncbi:hypothetical protein OKW20_004489 [Ensifer sp. LBL]
MARIDAECLGAGFFSCATGDPRICLQAHFQSPSNVGPGPIECHRSEFEAAPAKTEGARAPLTQGAAIRRSCTTPALAISSAWEINLGATYQSAAKADFITPGLRALTNPANNPRSPQQGLHLECAVATPDSSQTCTTHTSRSATNAREATLAAAILFGSLQAVAPSIQHLLCFLKRLSTVMPSVIQQEIVGARVEPRSTRNQFETSAGAQAPSDKLQTPTKGTA